MTLLFASLDRTAAAHLLLALRLLRQWLREQALPVPDELVDLENVLREASTSDRERQEATDVEAAASDPHHRHMPPPLLLDKAAAAAQLAVSQRTVERLVAAGDLPVVDVGARGVRFRRVDLEAFVEQRTTGTSEGAA